MRVRKDVDLVIVDGLPEGAVFCGPVTAAVLEAHVRRGETIEREATNHEPGLYISDIRMELESVVRRRRRGGVFRRLRVFVRMIL